MEKRKQSAGARPSHQQANVARLVLSRGPKENIDSEIFHVRWLLTTMSVKPIKVFESIFIDGQTKKE